MTDRTPTPADAARAERIRRIVDQAPPLSDETRRRVSALLRAPADTAVSRPAAA
ncbi:hypothetical protein [Pseudonocardia hydrocarbonoxydans]|uniref:Uncharacterized protein n=2 Tax=Pseudonocardia hydrocarbonoxydans TaxID=76726 RepID=A0A4Y3WZS2_9PSEU|nr:hypothetical protein PHY01_52390 [Pseudonocardia hydrocarbonoxydans]